MGQCMGAGEFLSRANATCITVSCLTTASILRRNLGRLVSAGTVVFAPAVLIVPRADDVSDCAVEKSSRRSRGRARVVVVKTSLPDPCLIT